MTDHVTLQTLVSGYDLRKINSNFNELARVLNSLVLYRNPNPGTANALEKDLDLNGKRLINAAVPEEDSDLVTKKWVEDRFDPSTNEAALAAAESASESAASALEALSYSAAAATSASNALASETSSSTNASNALTSANNAASSAAQAAVYSSLGLGGASAFDFGSVTDLIIIFPTDFGTIA